MTVNGQEKKESDKITNDQLRNILGFWFLGLTNDFGFTVMLSAAHDLLTPYQTSNVSNIEFENRKNYLIKRCNPIGTGVILLADTLPEVIVKILAPFFIYYLAYKFKVGLTVCLMLLGIILVSIGGNQIVWLSIVGVSICSAGTGLGEVVYLGLSSFFNRNCVSSWCSGTGAAGVAGALIYASLTCFGVSPKLSIELMTIVPICMICSYLILVTPSEIQKEGIICTTYKPSEEENFLVDDKKESVISKLSDKSSLAKELTYKEKFLIFKEISGLIAWFSLTYFFLYFINQVIFEIIIFENIWLEASQQYTWYQVICQIGIFIARSSVNIVYISRTWIFLLVEFAIFLILMSIAIFQYLPSIFIVFFLILIEGLAAGASYVNTYYAVTHKVDQKNLEFAMVITCISDSAGTVLAGVIAIPIHQLICSL